MQRLDRHERNWNVKKKNSCRSTELNRLTASEYKRWLEAVAQADSCIRRYGNWSAPPWIITKCGADAVIKYLQEYTGKPLTIRTAVYHGTQLEMENTYYIIEVKKS